jgi:hypothetical protein
MHIYTLFYPYLVVAMSSVVLVSLLNVETSAGNQALVVFFLGFLLLFQKNHLFHHLKIHSLLRIKVVVVNNQSYRF